MRFEETKSKQGRCQFAASNTEGIAEFFGRRQEVSVVLYGWQSPVLFLYFKTKGQLKDIGI